MPPTAPAMTDGSVHHPAWVRRAFESDSAEPDLDRVRRIGARFLGLGLIGYPIVSAPAIIASAPLTAPWWPLVSILLSVGPGIMLIVASFRPGTAWLSPLALTTWAGYLLGIMLWFVAWTGTSLADSHDSAQWMVAFCGMPSMVLMLVHPRLGVTSLVVSSVAAQVSQQLGRFGELTPVLVLEILWSFAFTGVFLAVVLVATRTGRMLDETREETYRSAASVAAGSAREVEKARFDAIVHDRVIASLLAVEAGRPDARLAAQAASALDELAQVPEQTQASGVSRAEAIRRIRSASADISETSDVEIVESDPDDPDPEDRDPEDRDHENRDHEDRDHEDRDPDDEVDGHGAVVYPTEVVDAVVEAMSEALRNVIRHAGPDADCAVLVQFAPDALSMAVVDNGVGFEPGGVAPGRLGIEVSIRGRLARVPGGHAHVNSRPGRGTTVQIRWERP
ncbi:sensor histidine kinase [Gordonia jinghuaiqii]|uniref:ATP-binding protein n=1 Tax=Gordonia jinghuaiqii TaxID=2758710 RepID=A0A7D7QGV1_9ACTN|nr:ATP-binding protein [Gordonia jinghuaiqii]QMT00724.1 ATP-binding protein [Gordonia jinghuaiqii]